MMRISLLAFITLISVCASAQVTSLDSYNISWKSQSKNASESMPCGGGDIGLNVWVENGDLLIYVARSGMFDENNALLKAGRLRIRMEPNPFDSDYFEQKLTLRDGFIRITAGTKALKTDIDVWVDVFRPVAHVEVNTSIPTTAEVSFESWRHVDRKLSGKENNSNSYKWAPQGDVRTRKDEIKFLKDDIVFSHRNDEVTVFDITVKQQGLEGVKNDLYNPLANLTSGGLLRGKNMKPDGTSEGKYQDTEFQAWRLRSIKATRHHDVSLYLHVNQTKTLGDWNTGLNNLVASALRANKDARTKTQTWWHQFWDRSFIYIQPDRIQEDVAHWQAGQNYQLFRYMLGCNAFGTWPTKFNGGLFTYDPVFTDSALKFTPDFRNWGGGTMTAQNQRLVYFPMFKSGDLDMIKSQLDFYLRILRNAELRSEIYWRHNGACFTEQMEIFGLPNCTEYGWNRPADFDMGVEYNAWLEYQWDTVLEFCLMMLEMDGYFGDNITNYIPFIESCLTFFDEHYQYLANERGSKSLDGNGHLILYPGSANETYKMTYNATPTIAALKVVLSRLLELPPEYLTNDRKKKWTAMLGRIPPITFTQHNERKTIAPAQVWERINNVETPQLYPVFPWGIYGVGKPDLDVAINTWTYDPHALKVRSHKGWKQDNIFAARMGLTNEAAELTVLKLKNSDRRFPAFWGPGFDWTPDHNWGGSGMIGLQEMLLQTKGDTVYLFPAWPKAWDVHFKLHAPKNTTIEARLRNGVAEILNVTPETRRRDVIVYLEQPSTDKIK